MALKNIVEIIFDLGMKAQQWKGEETDQKLNYFKDNYSEILSNEIFKLNTAIINNSPDYTENDSLLIAKTLSEIKQLLPTPEFIIFLESCSLRTNDSLFLINELDNTEQNNSIINLLSKLIVNQSFDIIKDYRESPQARKDIKTQINNDNISSSILNPFLMLLAEKSSPALRMELWQKFEMYFESGWGFHDLTTNEENNPIATHMQAIIKQINNEEEIISSKEGLGKELLNLLSERITELGVPIKISMVRNPINNMQVPTAHIIEDNREGLVYSFSSKKTMPSGYVDWAIKDKYDSTQLHCALATSDETCNIENSEAFRYQYALKQFSINNKHNINHIKLSFYSISSFYDEYDLDHNYPYSKPNMEIGKIFLERYSITKDQRKILNTIPFFAMSHKISSNLKTGIYSPDQLMSYNFKILGAESIIENKTYTIENIYKESIKTILEVFSQDNVNDYYIDGKSLNMLNQLHNLIVTSKDEFFENQEMFDFITSNDTLVTLKSILKKIPENQNNEKQVNKNDFNTLMQSLKYMGNFGYEKFVEEQKEAQLEFINEDKKVKELISLGESLLYIEKINEDILNNQKNIKDDSSFKDFINMTPKEQKLKLQELLIEMFAANYSDGRTNYESIFRENKTIHNYDYLSYPKSTPTYYKHVKMFNKWDEERSSFLTDWINDKIKYPKSEDIFKMCYFYIRTINEFNFKLYSLPKDVTYFGNGKKFKDLFEMLNPTNVSNFYRKNEELQTLCNNLKQEKDILLESINKHYSQADIQLVARKLDLKYDDFLLFDKNKLKIN